MSRTPAPINSTCADAILDELYFRSVLSVVDFDIHNAADRLRLLTAGQEMVSEGYNERLVFEAGCTIYNELYVF